MFNGKQVGAIVAAIFDIQRIDVRPTGCGHGTKFIKLMIKVARERGHKQIRVQGVYDDTSDRNHF